MSVKRIRVARIICALTGAMLGFADRPASAATPAETTLKVGKPAFTGSPKTICVIEGLWADGQPFRFEAWDQCHKMEVRRVNVDQYAGSPSLGEKDDYEVTDIPVGAEVLEVGNEHSVVLLFRDREGVMRQILVRD